MVVPDPAENAAELPQRRWQSEHLPANLLEHLAHALAARRERLGRVTAVVAALGLGILMTWLVVDGLGVPGPAVAVTCLVLPVLAVLAFSDRLSEITAGGFSAKFRKTAKRPVNTLMVGAVTPAFLPMRKGGLRDLEDWIAHNRHNSLLPVVLTLELREQYAPSILQRYVAVLSRWFPHFAYVAVLDTHGRHLSHLEPSAILESEPDDMGAPDDESFVGTLVRIIRDGQIEALYELPGMRRETVRASAPLKKALQLMRTVHSARLLVVDVDSRPVGVLQQADALTEIMLSITAG